MMTKEEEKELCVSLWSKHEFNLRRICSYKLSGQPEDAEDVLSDTFLALCEAVKEGIPISNPRAWLYATVNNLIKMKYNELSKSRNKLISISDDPENTLYDLPYEIDIINLLINDEDIELIKDEIENCLSDSERELIKYVCQDKMRMRQIAEMLDSTEFAVKQKFYRTSNKVKKLAKEKIEKFL